MLTGLVIGGGIGVAAGVWFMGMGLPKNATPRDTQYWQGPMLRKVAAEAEIERNDEGVFLFSWIFRTPSGEVMGNTVPLDEFAGFEFGSGTDWFTNPHERDRVHEMYTIMLHSRKGPLCVAAHGGAKADIAELHAVLTRLVLVATRAAPGSTGASAQAQPLASPSRDDLPSSLRSALPYSFDP